MKPKTIDSIINSISFSMSRGKNDISPQMAKDQLLDLFMSCVPEEKNVDTANNAVANSNYYGFNTCRDQMIKNLEKLK